MLDKYLVKMTMSALDAKRHPLLENRRCVNFKQGKTHCDKCNAVCPEGILTAPEKGAVKWDACVDCGLCAVVCPSGALGLSGARLKRALDLFRQEKPERVLGCEMAQTPMDYKGWCLGALPWEMISALALTGKVTLCRGACEGCARKGAYPVFEETLARCETFLGAALYESRVVLRGPGEEAQSVLTRREAFGALFSGMKRTVSASLPEESRLKNDGMLFRLLLVHRLEHLEDGGPSREGYGWLSPKFSDACWACGICEKICPNQAISVAERNGARYLVHEPCLCTGCGACAAVCPERAIGGVAQKRLSAGIRCVATRVESASCAQCGAPLRPAEAGSLCQRCKAKQRQRQ